MMTRTHTPIIGPKAFKFLFYLVVFANIFALVQAPAVFSNWEQIEQRDDGEVLEMYEGPWDIYGLLAIVDVGFLLLVALLAFHGGLPDRPDESNGDAETPSVK